MPLATEIHNSHCGFPHPDEAMPYAVKVNPTIRDDLCHIVLHTVETDSFSQRLEELDPLTFRNPPPCVYSESVSPDRPTPRDSSKLDTEDGCFTFSELLGLYNDTERNCFRGRKEIKTTASGCEAC
ncbi:hypothetical protein RRG08_063242 [Elysia crispata]|uniref:Uncharacterized protein n=1 Tax=Elysia crispata TaxID=231223 RepID=A0AAE1CVH9_9GAST|nr:hypothetical protein RRG08_063242 [Elysia crispata]